LKTQVKFKVKVEAEVQIEAEVEVWIPAAGGAGGQAGLSPACPDVGRELDSEAQAATLKQDE